MTVEAWLRKLCDLTVAPPQTDDVDQLVRESVDVVAARTALLADPPASFAGAPHSLLEELATRQEAWRSALAVARDRIGAQRVGATQVRRYQRSTDAADV